MLGCDPSQHSIFTAFKRFCDFLFHSLLDVKLQQIGYLPNKKWLLCAVVYQISQFKFKFLVMTEKKIFVIKYFSFYFIFLVKIAIPLKLKLSIKKGFCSFFWKII